MKTSFKVILREKMEEKGISVRKLSKITGLSNPAICNYLAGRRTPKITDADKMLESLGATLILGGGEIQ